MPARPVAAVGAPPSQATAVRAAPPRKAPRARKAPHHITAEQALANTRELLEAKHARERETPPWRQLDPDHGHPAPHAAPVRNAEQEAAAHAHAEDLHRAESRMDATQGSISERDRHRQGRQDAKH
ncbi:ABC-type nickel/cobalt efflux system permease component RcnA [Lysobacter niabensis]|uniref:ABC-type nickel/cobalt efflux system permease component RcnA n=1 Tax=Agrilutibacter niabensis TaxID=380628 RepID=A0ABU1VLH7_9GAMM|nr:hypothetical protein [Lysobacter niabensis]MDR7098336.1 ABC-type nickel/cobalt efflux system permease component RcnA [Lysobacter niabensis]